MQKLERRELKVFGSKKARKFMAELEAILPLRVRYNSPYAPHDYRQALVGASVMRESAESLEYGPSPDSLLRNTRLDMEMLEDLAECIIERQLELARRNGAFRAPVDIALDFFCASYYGKKRDEFVVGGKQKAGTNYFHSWLMADSVVAGERFCLGFVPRTIWSHKHELVEELILRILRMGIPIGKILMDREFPGFDVIEVLMRYNLKFIAAVKDDARIERAKAALKKSRNSAAIIPYELRKRKRSLTINLALVKSEDGKEVYSWFTNQDDNPREIAGRYSMRWGTETNNRERNKYRARTTSNRYPYRYLLFALSVALHNLWVLLNFILSMQLYGFATAPILRSSQFKRIAVNEIQPSRAE